MVLKFSHACLLPHDLFKVIHTQWDSAPSGTCHLRARDGEIERRREGEGTPTNLTLFLLLCLDFLSAPPPLPTETHNASFLFFSSALSHFTAWHFFYSSPLVIPHLSSRSTSDIRPPFQFVVWPFLCYTSAATSANGVGFPRLLPKLVLPALLPYDFLKKIQKCARTDARPA